MSEKHIESKKPAPIVRTLECDSDTLVYCCKCRKATKCMCAPQRITYPKNHAQALVGVCNDCGTKKSTFVKQLAHEPLVLKEEE